jgi:hypothetical protein
MTFIMPSPEADNHMKMSQWLTGQIFPQQTSLH